MIYEVIVVHEDGMEEWVPCLEAKELDDGRLVAEVLLGNIIFRKPGRWRKTDAFNADDVRELVEAIESRCDAMKTLKRIRERSEGRNSEPQK